MLWSLRAASYALALWCLIATTTAQAAEIIDVIPEDALGFVIINNPAELSKKLQGTAGKLGAPPLDVLNMAKGASGIMAGLDDNGTAAIVALPPADGEDEPTVVIVLPIKDYDQFIAQLNPDDKDADIVEGTIRNEKVILGRNEKYVLITEPKYEDALSDALETEDGAADAVEPVAEFAGGQDVVLVITSDGMELLTEKALSALDDAQQSLQKAGIQGMEGAIAGLNIYRDLFEALHDEVTALAVGAKIDAAGLALGAYAAYEPEGEFAAAGKDAEGPAKRFAGIEAAPYVLAYSGGGYPEWMRGMSMKGFEMMKAMPGGEALDEKTLAEIAELTDQSFDLITGMSIIFNAEVADKEPLVAGFLGIVSVTDAQKAGKLQVKSVDLMKKLGAVMPMYKDMKVEKTTIVGTEAWVTTMDIGAMLKGEGMPPQAAAVAEPILQAVFGDGAMLTAYYAVQDKNTLVSTMNQERLVDHLGKQAAVKNSLADDPQIAATTALLPEESHSLFVLSPSGLVTFANSAIARFQPGGFQLPDFGDAPPLGFGSTSDADGWEARLVLPDALLTGIGQFIHQLQPRGPN